MKVLTTTCRTNINYMKLIQSLSKEGLTDVLLDLSMFEGDDNRYFDQLNKYDIKSNICITDFEHAKKDIIRAANSKCEAIILNPKLGEESAALSEKEIRLKISKTVELAKDCGLEVCLKNSCIDRNGRLLRNDLSDPYFLKELADELNIGICYDIGITNILGQNPLEFCRTLNDRIKSVIIRENNAQSDDSCIPFSLVNKSHCSLDYADLIRGMREINFDGLLIFDFKSSIEATSYLLVTDIVSYMHKIMDYFVWQINIEKIIRKYKSRVLFGAGNMCRNYMKNYAEEYRPLFTCDNNSSLWGSEFEGLAIKNPEALKDIPSECAIIICNQYYEEIEKQLRNMGISNPIERFSDEYLPVNSDEFFDSKTRKLL